MATPNLAITHIAASQNQKEVTANAAFDDLDVALTNNITEIVPDNHIALSNDDALRNMVFIFTGTLTAPRGITLPASKKLYIVSNQTSGSGSPVGTGWPLTFGTASSPTGRVATVEANSSMYVILYCDGVNVDRVSPEPELANYTVSTLPVSPRPGTIAYAVDGLKVGEVAGSGTGVPVYYSNGAWRVFSTDAVVMV